MKKGSLEDGIVYHAGFPNAGEDQQGQGLSLDKLVVRHRASTYFWRLETAIPEVHWPANSIVVVDRSVPPLPGKLAVAYVNDEFVACRIGKAGIRRLDGQILEQAQVWGVVTYVISEVV